MIEKSAKSQGISSRQLAAMSKPILILFLLVYNGIFSYCLAPIGRFLWNQALLHSPVEYITGSNLALVFRSPLVLITLLVIVLGYSFWALLEISFIVLCMDAIETETQPHLLPLFKKAIVGIVHVFKPENWPLLLFTAVVVPFTNVLIATDFISEIVMPDYIMEVITGNALYTIGFLAVTVGMVLWTLEWIFVYQFFVLERCSLMDAAKRSKALVNKHRISTFANILSHRVLVSIQLLALGGLLTILLFALFFILQTVLPEAISAGKIVYQYIYRPSFLFFFGCMNAFVRYACITLLYHKYQQTDTAQPESAIKPVTPTKERPPYRGLVRLIICLVVIAGMLAVPLLAVTLQYTDVLNPFLHETIAVTSHRGYSAVAPENTLPSFQAAIDCGASDYAELDVQQTKDGVVVVTHDTNLKRCTGVDVDVTDISYDQVQQLDAGQFFLNEDDIMEGRFAETRIPTLDEVIQLCKGKIKLNIEIKGNTPTLEAEVVRIIRENAFVEDCVVTSLRYDALEKVKVIAPEIKCGLILAMGAGYYYDLPAADFFSVETTFVNAEMVQELHSRGKDVHVWTVDNMDQLERLRQIKVDNIITNQPLEVYDYLQEPTNNFFDLLTSLYHSLKTEYQFDDDSIGEILAEAA